MSLGVETDPMTVRIYQFMGTGWKRKTLAWYNRFQVGEEKVGEEKVIGADLKVAHVYMETEDRQPTKLRLVEYEKHELNSDGHIDKVIEQSKMSDAVNLIPPRTTKSIGRTTWWKPNPGQENLLMQKLSALDVPL